MSLLHSNKKLVLFLIFGFVLSTIVGTVTHELGHYTAARILGIKATIHYNYTETFLETNKNNFLIRIAGPLQTIFFSFIGIAVLISKKESFKRVNKLNLVQWIIIFLSLFSLRFIFNFFINSIYYFVSGNIPTQNDEIAIAVDLGLSTISISFITAILSCVVAYLIIFKIIPISQRYVFIFCGLIGSSLGYYLWFILTGPLLLP